MDKVKISLIVAIDEKGGIGKAGAAPLLWHIPEDLKRFKELTLGHAIIMGRRTLESIGFALNNRTNIVITKDVAYRPEGALVLHSLEEAIKIAKEEEQDHDTPEVFIIGGGKVFEQAIGLADKIYLTKIEGDFGADTFFPDYSNFKKVVYEKDGESNGHKYKFIDLEKN